MANLPLKLTVTTDVSGIEKFERLVQSGLDNSNKSSPTRVMFVRWATRWRAFHERRFVKASRGGGTWQALSIATVAGRRQGGGSGSAAILRDTGTLFGALGSSNAPGALEKHDTDVVFVGYKEGSQHSSGISIAQLARWHQTGAGNLPSREIVVEPDNRTTKGFATDANDALVEIENDTNI
jgi:hypothetical protein